MNSTSNGKLDSTSNILRVVHLMVNLMVHWIVLRVVLSDGTSNSTSNSTLDGSSYESSDGTLYDGFEHCL